MDVNSSEPSSSSSFIPLGQLQRSSPRLREQQLMFQVLDNPSLREEILKRGIFGNDKKVDQRAAGILRLVQKSWDQSVLRILWQAREPFYKLVAGTGSCLGTYTKRFSVSSRIISGPPPPLMLEGYCHLFEPPDVQTFSNFMTACGPALLQMTCVIYELGILVTTPFPAVDNSWWSLSRLHKLEIGLRLRRGAVLAAEGNQGGEGPHKKISECLLNSIFRGATALAELDLSINKWSYDAATAPDLTIFDSVTLPPTLVKVKADLPENCSEVFLRALLRSPIPKLRSLSLSTGNAIFSSGLLFSIMDKFKASLKALEIVGGNYEGPPRNVILIRFPVMQLLEELSISSISAELESGLDSLERCLPKLRTLRLRLQTPGMLRKWTESSRFTGVTSLELLLADENEPGGNDTDNFLMSVNMEAMQLVRSAFPNLRKLEVGISRGDPSGLQYVFMEMRQLVELKLKIFGDMTGITTYVWDSILTGVPRERLGQTRRNLPGSLNIYQNLASSLVNLQELKSFSLKDCRSFRVRLRELGANRRSLISDFVFNHGLLRMPKLSRLHFEGPFKVSPRMRVNWELEGRSLVYQRFRNGLPVWQLDEQ